MLPICRMAASSLEISQFSVSVNIRTFMADRILEYSFISFLPSQTVQFPWMPRENDTPLIVHSAFYTAYL